MLMGCVLCQTLLQLSRRLVGCIDVVRTFNSKAVHVCVTRTKYRIATVE